MNFGSVGFGFLAGIFSILSPCVLPILPLVLGAAVATHRAALPLLALGMALSFVAVGLFVGTIGFAIGIDGDALRWVSALLLGAFGLVLLLSGLETGFARATAPLANAANQLAARLSPASLGGQFLFGVILGAVWSPCVGPTLGAASLLAAQGRDLGGVAAVMLAFGIGAAIPLLVLGLLSRQALLRWRTRLLRAGHGGKLVVGGVAVAASLLILTGLDRSLEVALVEASPDWLTRLTTSF